jgi:hypothetical protein
MVIGFTIIKTAVFALNQSGIGSILVFRRGASAPLQCADAIQMRIGCEFKITSTNQRTTS